MGDKWLISICIPAYKNTIYLKRLLDSIASQTFTGYEVIVTDDSPDDSVKDFIAGYNSIASLHYYRNMPALGTPENWNEGIRRSNGQWLKLMHDDDWFAEADSLQYYVTQIQLHPQASFLYAAYANVYEGTGETRIIRPPLARLKMLARNPATLLSTNIIGPPSVTIYRNDRSILYNNRLKWLVDIEFYMRYLQQRKAIFLDQVLVNIGINQHQVTKASISVREVEIPEYFRVLDILGTAVLNNMMVFDAYWRLLRNLSVKKVEDIHASGYPGPIPATIANMIRFQQQLPAFMLKTGIISKGCMLIAYLKYRSRG